MFLKLFIFIFVYCGIATVYATDPQPKINPGYQPIDQDTEKGLWMELEEFETKIRRSSL